MHDGSTHLRWSRLFEFLVSPDGRHVRYRSLTRADPEMLRTYLLGQVLSFSLVARGVEPLHGTAVETPAGAAVFLGDGGQGKSTLGAAMLARGCRLVTDDLAHVARRAGRYVIHPGPSRVKLFPAAARATIGPRAAGRMNPGTSKLVVPLAATESVDRAVPVRALYLLEPMPPGGQITIDQLEPATGMLAVVSAAFNVSVVDRRRLAAQFAAAARLAASVPVKRLRYPRSLASLPSICDSVLADLRP